MTIYHNSNINTLNALSANLHTAGFTVSPIVVPEISAVSGNPYLVTSATNRDIQSALRK